MNNNHFESNKLLLVGLVVLMVVVGLACDAVLGTAEAPDVVVETPVSALEDTAEQDLVATVEGALEDTAEEAELPSLLDAVETFEDVPTTHDDNVVYPDTGAPQPGGVHASIWQNCGVYTVPVEDKNVLHSLEHGAVWLTYDPALSEDEVGVLQELAIDQAYTVMSPYPGLRSAVVLTAWGVQFETDSVNDPRILEFLLYYQQGPQTPELGAPCQGGIGSSRAPGSLGVSSS